MSTKGPTEDDRRVGAKIRLRRLASGVSQEKLAAAIGVTFQQVQKYEKGTNRIPSGRLPGIAATLGVAPAYFFPAVPNAAGAVADEPPAEILLSREGRQFAAAFAAIPLDARPAFARAVTAIAALRGADATAD